MSHAGALTGKPDQARLLASSSIRFGLPGSASCTPPNLAPGPETGLARGTDVQIARAIGTGAVPIAARSRR